MDDVSRIMNSLGITEESVSGVFGDLDIDQVSGIILTEDDVGAVIRRYAPGMDIANANNLAQAIYKGTAPVERAYAAAAAARIAETNLRPNMPLGLYATSWGQPCSSNQKYELRPRNGGSLEGEPFIFTPTMSFFELTSDPRDCALGFHLVANTVGFGDDVAKSIRYDVPLSAFRPERRPEQNPMASLMKRSPKNNVKFTASVYFDGQPNTTAFFYGMTLVIYDSACRSATSQMLDNLADLDFSGLAREIMQSARQRFSLSRNRRGNGSGFSLNPWGRR